MVLTVAKEEQSESLGLFLDGVLIETQISYWRGKRPLTAEDLGADPNDIPDIFTLGRKLIVPKDALAAFQKIEARSHYITEQFTFPFPTGRARFIPYSVLEGVIEKLKQAQQEFNYYTEQFFEHYEEYRQEFIEKYPDWKDALEKGYIGEPELRKRFKFGYLLYEVSLPKGARFKAVQERDAVDDAKARESAIKEAEEEYKAQFREQIDTFLVGSVAKLRAAVGDAVINVAEKLEKGDVVTSHSLNSLKNTIDKFRTLNFIGDTEVSTKLAELEALIPESGKKFEEEEFKASFQTVLDSVTNTILESDISVVTGEYKRKLRI